MARPKGIWTPERVKERIRAGLLTERLIAHALGRLKMKSSQIRAAVFLLERVVPRAEAPKHLDITGHISLENLISGALTQPSDERPRTLSS